MLNRPAGFTLIESVIVLALLAVLATISYPSYADHVRKGKRSDAWARLAALQLAEEHWRATHPAYGSLEDLGLTAAADGSPYRLAISDPGRDTYTATATALGAQSDDAQCRVLRLMLSGGETHRSSGSDELASNDTSANSWCWPR